MKKVLNPNFTKKEIKYLLQAFSSIKNGALTFFGPSGTAKSHLIEGIATELGWGYIKIIAPSLLLHHLAGKPDFERGIDNPMSFIPTKKNLGLTEEENNLLFAKKAFLEISKRLKDVKTSDTIILHLDEIFRIVNRNVATLLFGMISDRMVGMGADNDIPDNVVIIMSGNLEKGQSISLGDIASLSRMVLIPFPVLKDDVLNFFEKEGLIDDKTMKNVISKAIGNFTKKIANTSIPESYQAIQKGLRNSVGNLRQIDYYLRLLNCLYPLYSVGEVSANFLDIVDIGALPSQQDEDKLLIKSMRELYKPTGISLKKLESLSWEEIASKKGVEGTLLCRLKFHFGVNGVIKLKESELIELLLTDKEEFLKKYESLSGALLGYGIGLLKKFLEVKINEKEESLFVYLLGKQKESSSSFAFELLKVIKK